MSRVLEFSDGAERGDTSWWTVTTGSVATGVGESGAYCYEFGHSEGAYKTITTPLSEMYFRARVKFNGVTSQATIALRAGTSALVTMTQNQTFARIDITGATTGNTGNNSLTFGWQVLEVYYKISDTVGVLTVRIDGVEKFTFSGDTKPGADSTIDNLLINMAIGSNAAYFDDFAIDTAAWCGLGYYVALTPDGAGDVTQWTPTGAANYQNVSIPANDATFNTGATGQTDNYAMTTITLGSSMVERIIPFVRASNPSGGTINVGLKTGGTNYTAGIVAPTSLTWLIGSEYAVSPNTSAEWTQTDLNNIQFTATML